MRFEIGIARDGNQTLTVNGIHIYSKYKPRDHAEAFIEKELNFNAEGYLLLGLGLGYHLKAITNKVNNKKIYVMCVDKKEEIIYKKSDVFEEMLKFPNIYIVNHPKDIKINNNYQIIIPNAWLQVLDYDNPIYNYLADIKIKQESYRRNKPLLDENFSKNLLLNDRNIKDYITEIKIENKIACLVSSGPSLNETKSWIKEVRDKLYILCVGSALKVLLKEDIKPDAVVISDPKKSIVHQLEGTNFDGSLLYLSTANNLAISNYPHNKYILFQSGYKNAEELARLYNVPLVETGGSVATTGFSTLELLGFDTVILFGQDLGFIENHTHANYSTSGRTVSKNENLLKVKSNIGEEIYTTPNLHSYLMWFNNKIKNSSKIKVFNTALNGAKINNVESINQRDFYELVNI
ncbi:motility associated factor glycosyltransferase family protein [Lysinibacillus telephonicus]|uniref:DUF115 domain-containing protein n=1 Tax=Lysinibacillus telephonicus TaxID=1714840 RepID=A0A3S0HMH4_9BACI|nr:6-hydroxymethylpterin diphosphokinase MptE-like protein [Lysinibacillus telephonicus]RTQ94293.1 DUF115 domain-containing protein [Lysinibacillus telephonicus]